MTTAASRLRPVIGAILVAAVLAGCSTGVAAQKPGPSTSTPAVPLAELNLLTDPSSWQGQSTALLSESSMEPVASAPEQSLPATVVSHDPRGDTAVTVKDTSRVIGLDMSGSIAATIVGLGFGDKLVGRDASSTFAEVADLPQVTSGGHSINSEAVIALRPTLIVTDGTIGPMDVLLQLRQVGIPLVFVDPSAGIAGVYDLATQVGHALGADATGELLANKLRGEVEAKVAEVAAIAPKDRAGRLRMAFLYIRGNSGVYYLFGKESGADDLVEALGGIDVASEIGWSGMKPMTDEALIAANPDLILVMTSGLKSAGGVDGLLAKKPAIAITKAGQNRRFVDMNSGEILSFGPRTAHVIDALARAIYAPGGVGSGASTRNAVRAGQP